MANMTRITPIPVLQRQGWTLDDFVLNLGKEVVAEVCHRYMDHAVLSKNYRTKRNNSIKATRQQLEALAKANGMTIDQYLTSLAEDQDEQDEQ